MNQRFDQAILKLYQAFHNGELQPECACHCAVGTILDRGDQWKHFSDDHGSLHLNYIGKVNEAFGKRLNGYLPSELLKIEAAFLKGCGYSLPYRHNGTRPSNTNDKNLHFRGLEAVIAVLCSLDGKTNIMDYTQLFDPANNTNLPESNVNRYNKIPCRN